MTARALAALSLGLVWLAGCESCHSEHRSPAASVATAPATPACRLDQSVPNTIWRTATMALERVKKRHPFEATGIAVNAPDAPLGYVRLEVVLDAKTNEVDPSTHCPSPHDELGSGPAPRDMLSIDGICFADQGLIRCSSGALWAIMRAEGPREVSPTLLFLLSHELTHIALRDPGALAETGVDIQLSAPAERKQSELRSACFNDAAMLKVERRADDEAMAVLVAALTEPELRPAGDTPALAIADNTEIVYRAAQALLEWGSDTYGERGGSISPMATQVCEVMLADAGTAQLPVLAGGHPHAWSRIGSLMKAGLKAESAIDRSKLTRDEEVALSFLESNATLDPIMAQATEAGARYFCRQVRLLEAGKLDCTHWRKEASIDVGGDFDDQ